MSTSDQMRTFVDVVSNVRFCKKGRNPNRPANSHLANRARARAMIDRLPTTAAPAPAQLAHCRRQCGSPYTNQGGLYLEPSNSRSRANEKTITFWRRQPQDLRCRPRLQHRQIHHPAPSPKPSHNHDRGTGTQTGLRRHRPQ